MPSEQEILTIETLAESVRSSMTAAEANESLEELSKMLQGELGQDNDYPVEDDESDCPAAPITSRMHELLGQMLRSLVPAFVMTDADFKVPNSLVGPTKAMIAVRDASMAWLLGVCERHPEVCDDVKVDLVAYRRRMHMTILDEETSVTVAPPTLLLDPVVGLLERMAVRCPDKSDWRRAVIDGIYPLVIDLYGSVGNRFVHEFLPRLMTSEKSPWRVFAIETAGALESHDSFRCVVARTRDCVATVRAAALKSAAIIYLTGTPTEEGTQSVLDMIARGSCDEKPIVRKATLTVLDMLMPIKGPSLLPLAFLEQLCRDESLQVRKSAIGSVIGLMHEEKCLYSTDLLAELFCKSVLQMTSDVETTVIEKALEAIDVVLVVPICNAKKNTTSALLQSVLETIGKSTECIEYTKRALKQILRQQEGGTAKLAKQLTTAIERMLTSSSESASESNCDHYYFSFSAVTLLHMLEELCAGGWVQNCGSLLSVWKFQIACNFCENAKSFAEKNPAHHAALFASFGAINQLFRKASGDKFKDEKNDFSNSTLAFLQTPKPTAYISCIHAACSGLAAARTSPSIFQPLLEQAEAVLFDLIYAEKFMDSIDLTVEIPRNSAVMWNLYLLGEIASSGHLPSAKGLTAIEAIGTNRVYHTGGVHYPLSPQLRGAGMVTLGKICLSKESIAKRAISKFAAHLSKEEHPIVRNNVLLVLGDLCVSYTGLVDQYLPWLTSCLGDSNDLIRMQTAAIVSALLAEDYIKFKGPIVYRLLYLLSDPCLDIQRFVESVFSRILFLRHSGSLKTLFAETVCALNGYLRHPAYQGAYTNGDFCLSHNRARRIQIYKFILARVDSTEQKFNVTAQLTKSLLAAFVDEDATNGSVQIPTRENDPAAQVLIDTLWLLSCPELKLTGGPATQDDDTTSPNPINQVLQKKSVVDEFAPLLVQLNRLCEQKRSPISAHVRACLTELVKDYRDEVGSILQADAQLAQELLFDLAARGEVTADATVETPEVVDTVDTIDAKDEVDIVSEEGEMKVEAVSEPIKKTPVSPESPRTSTRLKKKDTKKKR